MLLLLASLWCAQAEDIEVVHQGRLLDAAGAPITGARRVQVGLYADETGGTPLFAEAFELDLADGYYQVTLGADPGGPALSADRFDGTPLWVGVSVGPPLGAVVELGARARLADVPRAARAGSADRLEGQTAAALGAAAATAANTGSLTLNPAFEQGFDHWHLRAGAGAVVSLTDARAGRHAYQNDPGSVAWIRSADLVPVNPGHTYQVQGSFRRVDTTGTVGTIYLAVALFDADGALLYDGNEDGTWYYYPVSSVALTGTAWRDYRYELGAGTERPIPPTARFMAVGAILNYNGGNRTYQVTDLAIRQLPGAPAYTALSLLNGWTNYSTDFHPAGYARDATGHVHLRGLVRNGTMSADIAELPVGYRPGKRCLFTTQSHDDVLGRIDVFPDGSVYAHGGNNVWINLEGITFLAEQ